MTRTVHFVLAAAALAAGLAASGCATNPDKGPAWTVVEPNATIFNRGLIRRIAILDDDLLLIEEAPNTYYQVHLTPACADMGDLLEPIRIVDPGAGVDRSSRFVIGRNTCFARSIDRVERVRPDQGAQQNGAAPAPGAAPKPDAPPAGS